MINADLLIKALGEKGGVVKAVTDEETVTVYVMDGFSYVSSSLRNTVSVESVRQKLQVVGSGDA